MAQEKKSAPKALVDTSIVDPKRIGEMRLKAAATVDKERKLAAESQLLDQFEAEARREHGLEEDYENVFIDLAPYADRLMIDGKILFQGQTKRVRHSQAELINEMIQATWRHQSIVDGKPEDFYRKSRGQRVIPVGDGGVAVSNILRA